MTNINADKMTEPEGQPDITRWHRAKIVLAISTVAVILAGLIAPVALLVWRAQAPTVVMQESPAGTLRSVTVHASLLRTTTTLSTSVGNIVVDGAFAGPRGAALTIQQTNKASNLRVCAENQPPSCASLVGTWAGPMRPTSVAGQTTDFTRLGLTTRNFAGWFGMGFAALCVMALLWVIAFNLCDGAITLSHEPADPD